jgi:hypothetical protein
MRINLFEGARRIALIAAGLVTTGTAIALIVQQPYQSTTYLVESPDSPFKRIDDSCPSDAAKHYFTAKTSTGKEVNVHLCILAMSFGEKEDRLIPYKIDERGVWGDRSYSSNVTAYEKTLETRFKVPIGDEEAITKAISQRYRENLTKGFAYLVAGLAIFAAIVWAIGWIARGFLGIPRGMDTRPDQSYVSGD